MIRLTEPSDVSGGTAYAAQARMQSGDYNDKKQALKAVVFLAVFLWLLVTVTYIIRTNGDVKDRFTGFYAEKKIRLMRSWWARARCILITARLRSTGKAALQRIRSRQITSVPKRSNICSKRRKKPRTRRCLSLRCGCFPCRTRNGRIRWYSRAG